MGAYRFFDNPNVDWRAILEPHWQQTTQRTAAQSVVLCLQDTTELDFNGQQAQGLGPLSYEAQHGMYVHPTYAVTTAREPLGILAAGMWAREPKGCDGQRGGPKESLRWIEGYERLAELAPNLPATRLVYVADREADMIPLMARAQELACPVDWLVRAAQNRCLPDSEKLWPHTTQGAALGQIEFTLASRPGTKARVVRQHLWARRVDLPAGKNKTVSATCIVAREYCAPAGVKPIEWRLLTNRTAIDAAAVSDRHENTKLRPQQGRKNDYARKNRRGQRQFRFLPPKTELFSGSIGTLPANAIRASRIKRLRKQAVYKTATFIDNSCC